MKENTMRFIICFVAFGLCLLMGACPWLEGEFDIDIGDYDNQLEAWNSQNMLDYQIMVECGTSSNRDHALITVRSGIPESSDPKYWLEQGVMSTIPEFYSFIKSEEKIMEDKYNSGGNKSLILKVSYNTEYHYPNEIIWKGSSNTVWWEINLMPLEEGDLDIDVGDYESQLEAWNRQNMLDYQIKVGKPHGAYGYSSFGIISIYNVTNGIPDDSGIDFTYFTYRLKEATVLAIYSFIKEEEERIRNVYNGINRSYLHVQYDTEYHYPMLISSGVGHHFGSYERWEITITPGGTE